MRSLQLIVLLSLITTCNIASYAQMVPSFYGGYGPRWTGIEEPDRDLEHSVFHSFKVTFPNDSVAVVQGKIDFYKGYYLRINIPKDMAIGPNKTKSISRLTRNGTELTGIANDTCWLFKVGSGKINAYSPLAEDNIWLAKAFQAGSGSVLPLIASNLLPFVADDPKAKKLAEKGKLIKAIIVYNRSR